MIVLREIDTLRDGGSVVMKLWVISSDLQKYNLVTDSGFVTIMVDYSANTDTPGVWYNNLKQAGGTRIDNEDFKNEVIKQLNRKIEREQFILNKLINEYEPNTTEIES